MGVAPAIILRKEKDLVAHSRDARAVSQDSAQSLGALRVDEDAVALRRLRNRAVIRQGLGGAALALAGSWPLFS